MAAAVTLRGIPDFCEDPELKGEFFCLYSQQLPKGAVMQEGCNVYSKHTFFHYIMVRKFIPFAMINSNTSPISPPVPRRIPSMVSEVEGGEKRPFSTPDPKPVAKRLKLTPGSSQPQFSTPMKESEKLERYRQVTECWVNIEPNFAASPNDSMVTYKGSPLMEEVNSPEVEIDEYRNLVSKADTMQIEVEELSKRWAAFQSEEAEGPKKVDPAWQKQQKRIEALEKQKAELEQMMAKKSSATTSLNEQLGSRS